jgi:predicted DNA-binding transcriptional regulator YafY
MKLDRLRNGINDMLASHASVTVAALAARCNVTAEALEAALRAEGAPLFHRGGSLWVRGRLPRQHASWSRRTEKGDDAT